jgi:aspartate/methionine/tyrosine aminotransferase
MLQPSILLLMQEKIAAAPKPLLPLHIGDTYVPPPEGAQLKDIAVHECSALYRYAHPSGLVELRQAVASRLARKGFAAHPDNVLITAGATHALSLAARGTLDPGEEVLVLTPHWPLIVGILRSVGAQPVEVPVHDTLYTPYPDDESATQALLALLRPLISPRTTGIYFSTPNNPDGKIMRPAHLEAVARVAREHDLWVFSDEVYDELVFDGRELPPSIATLPGMLDRTLVVHSFSKSHGLAGFRLGYVVCPPHLTRALVRLTNYSVYNIPVALQRAALAALSVDPSWSEARVTQYQAARDLLVERLKARFPVPEGGAYVFCDVREWLGGDPIWALLDRALRRGVSMAPGEGFGGPYEGYVRICFTAVALPDLARAVDILNQVLEPR